MTINTIILKEVGIFTELFLGITLVYIILYGSFLAMINTHPILQSALLKLSFLIIFFCCILLANDKSAVLKVSACNNSIMSDYVTIASKIFIGIFCFLCLLLNQYYIINQKINQFEYIMLFLFSVLGFFFLCSANDLITSYLAIELQSLSFYVLAAFKRESTFSVDAGLKYFILGAFASSLFLLGSSLIYAYTGTLNFFDLKDLFFSTISCENATTFDYLVLESQPLVTSFFYDNNFETALVFFEHLVCTNSCYFIDVFNMDSYQQWFVNNIQHFLEYYIVLETNILKLAVLLLLISLFFKLALAPFHLWAPDVYEGSLLSSTLFFAVMPKLGLFLLLTRLMYSAFYGFFESFKHFIIIIAVMSVAVGSVAGLEQRKIKNLLAYSSISHMGYSLLAYGSGTLEGIQFLFCYLFIYMCSSTVIWAIFLLTRLKTKFFKKQNKDLTDFMLLVKSNKMLAIYLTIAMLSVAGVPPMVGFIVKFGVFLVSIGVYAYNAACISIVLSVVSTFYYIRIIKTLFFEQKRTGLLYYPIPDERVIIVVVLLYFLLFFFINPNLLFLITYKISLILLF